jgi:phage terminase Nu1 subunit (DNA packaging protein)
MLAAREWVVGAIRGRLQRRYPDLSPVEINLKVLEELERAERRQARPQPIP